jgi:hypothetical protein
MIFCAISFQNTQGPIGPGQWKLGLKKGMISKHILESLKIICGHRG